MSPLEAQKKSPTRSITILLIGFASFFLALYFAYVVSLFSLSISDPLGGFVAAIFLFGPTILALGRAWLIYPANRAARIILILVLLAIVIGMYWAIGTNQSLNELNDSDL